MIMQHGLQLLGVVAAAGLHRDPVDRQPGACLLGTASALLRPQWRRAARSKALIRPSPSQQPGTGPDTRPHQVVLDAEEVRLHRGAEHGLWLVVEADAKTGDQTDEVVLWDGEVGTVVEAGSPQRGVDAV